jgi:hypothetical protein
MLSCHLFGELTPLGASALAGRGGSLELLIGMPVLGSTALAGREGPQELLCGERVPGSTALTGRGGTARAAQQSFRCR